MRILFSLLFISCTVFAQTISQKIDAFAKEVEPQVIQWRREIHQNPELSNREFKTSEKIAAHLRKLGIEVQTGIAHTGVVGILKGSKPGPCIALRADMDALPVSETVDLPFASKVKANYRGQSTGVMHACGHDTHVAILMGVAEVLTKMKGDLKGTVKFIFQPAEEGAPEGEEGGAELMVKQGVLNNPKVDVIFGLHIDSKLEIGKITYKPEGVAAAVDEFKIVVYGKQTHGAYPWFGVDPIVTSAQIINGLQTLVSRNLQITEAPAVVTVGAIHGGIRENIIPDSVVMIGTIRTLDSNMQIVLHKRFKEIVTKIAESAGAAVKITIDKMYPVVYNDPSLTSKMLPTLQKVAGTKNVILKKAETGAEDFAFFQKKVPGLYFEIGGRPTNISEALAPAHHTPTFYIDESGMIIGVKAFANMIFDYKGN